MELTVIILCFPVNAEFEWGQGAESWVEPNLVEIDRIGDGGEIVYLRRVDSHFQRGCLGQY